VGDSAGLGRRNYGFAVASANIDKSFVGIEIGKIKNSFQIV